MKQTFLLLTVFILINTTLSAQWTVENTENTTTGNIDLKNGGIIYGRKSTPNLRAFIQPYNTSTGHMTLWNEYGAGNILFGTKNIQRMIIDHNGNIGIGTDSPKAKLGILGNNVDLNILKLKNNEWACNQRIAIEFWNGGNKDYPTSRIVSKMDGCGTSGEALLFETQTAGETNPSAKMIIKNNGNVGVGTINPLGFKLAVKGKIGAEEVQVKANYWSDFVFNKDYDLQSLEEVESFIEDNNHLPDIPSEQEVMENGIQLGKMDAKLLQKIEELTLYMIEQNKMMKAQSKEIQVLRDKINTLEAQ